MASALSGRLNSPVSEGCELNSLAKSTRSPQPTQGQLLNPLIVTLPYLIPQFVKIIS